MQQWIEAVGLLADLLTAADAVMECFNGTLNKTVKDRATAVVEIHRRTEAYQNARNAAITYARAVEAQLG